MSPLGLAGVYFACCIAAGHGLDLEVLYRPISGGPASHPLTAITLGLLGLGTYAWRPIRTVRLPLVLASVVLGIALARLVEIVAGVNLLDGLPPYGTYLEAQRAAGKPIAMGANTAVMTALMACALILVAKRKNAAAQVLAFLSLAFPLVAMTGYAYGVERFHGQMALTTVATAMPIGFGILFAGASRGVLRSILSPWVGGRIARIQIVLGYFVPFLIGYLLILTASHNPKELFGLFVVLVSAFISMLVAYSAIIQEHMDRGRRIAERQLAYAAANDPLTGLPNRRKLLDAAQRDLERTRRSGGPLSVVMVDIDHFKRLNDRHGHAAGDLALQRVAWTMRSLLRRQDLVARYGGEEFVVLLPDTTLDGAIDLAEKIRRHIEAKVIDHEGENASAITVSAGCAQWREGLDFGQLIEAADRALYVAKSAGRNRVEPARGIQPTTRLAPVM